MTPTKHLRPATLEDAEYLAPRLRPEDLKELSAVSPLSPLETLTTGIALSQPAAVVLVDEETDTPYMIGGVNPTTSLTGDKVGLVWALATPDIERHPLAFQKAAKALLARLFEEEGYMALANVVSAANIKAVEWLRGLGFTFVHKDVPVGRSGELFHSFAMTGRPADV